MTVAVGRAEEKGTALEVVDLERVRAGQGRQRRRLFGRGHARWWKHWWWWAWWRRRW